MNEEHRFMASQIFLMNVLPDIQRLLAPHWYMVNCKLYRLSINPHLISFPPSFLFLFFRLKGVLRHHRYLSTRRVLQNSQGYSSWSKSLGFSRGGSSLPS